LDGNQIGGDGLDAASSSIYIQSRGGNRDFTRKRLRRGRPRALRSDEDGRDTRHRPSFPGSIALNETGRARRSL